jgi:hypothetical protein
MNDVLHSLLVGKFSRLERQFLSYVVRHPGPLDWDHCHAALRRTKSHPNLYQALSRLLDDEVLVRVKDDQGYCIRDPGLWKNRLDDVARIAARKATPALVTTTSKPLPGRLLVATTSTMAEMARTPFGKGAEPFDPPRSPEPFEPPGSEDAHARVAGAHTPGISISRINSIPEGASPRANSRHAGMLRTRHASASREAKGELVPSDSDSPATNPSLQAPFPGEPWPPEGYKLFDRSKMKTNFQMRQTLKELDQKRKAERLARGYIPQQPIPPELMPPSMKGPPPSRTPGPIPPSPDDLALRVEVVFGEAAALDFARRWKDEGFLDTAAEHKIVQAAIASAMDMEERPNAPAGMIYAIARRFKALPQLPIRYQGQVPPPVPWGTPFSRRKRVEYLELVDLIPSGEDWEGALRGDRVREAMRKWGPKLGFRAED